MTLFRIDSSIRRQGSVSREVADTLEQAWVQHHPVGKVVRRDLAAEPIPAAAWVAAATYGGGERTPEQEQGFALAATLADELLAADAIVIATPLYNFGINQLLKSYIDLLIIDPRLAPGTQPLSGRPVTIVMARGGGYGEGTPREGWDHATPYLHRIFADVLGADVTVVAAELTLAAIVPAMAELQPLAEVSRTQAHELAAATGQAHAALVAAAA
ncbi:FMN-dependent NADH-azoreductase [Pseudonocardia sp. GCM10023141]|uniref:FMN-dependent NADH-azoreductase n=1 Tax=Pseudonocardia sp. GCM10023141 TaxID=3252653 RepID=UPI00360829FB